ncbi:MAG: PorV/PorQ family protein [bacterium]
MKTARYGILVFSMTVTVLANSMAYSQAGNAGAAGLAFLKLGVGARASALGEAYTSMSGDATATYWNPAGLAALSTSQLTFTHTEWLQDISNDFLAVAFPGFGGTVGVSLYANRVDGIERRVIPTAEPIGTIDANDIAASLSYGRYWGDQFSAGVTVKYLYEKIYIESAAGYAFDFGVGLQPFEGPLHLGVVVQNLGSMDDLLDQAVQLPTTVRAGASYQIEFAALDGALVVAADGIKVRDQDAHVNVGAELVLKHHLAFRFGYQSGFEEKAFGGGFGLNFQQRYHLDYGYAPFSSNLGDTHRFSLSVDL